MWFCFSGSRIAFAGVNSKILSCAHSGFAQSQSLFDNGKFVQHFSGEIALSVLLMMHADKDVGYFFSLDTHMVLPMHNR